MSESERRDGPRIDLRLRVRYRVVEGSIEHTDLSLSGEAEASDVSPKGLRLEGEIEVPVGATVDLILEDGGDEKIETQGHVTWCSSRQSPTGRTMFDTGVHFEGDWLGKDRGPLATALAKVWSMNQYEIARASERTKVSLTADNARGVDKAFEIADLSEGGMHVRSVLADDALRTKGRTLVATFHPPNSSEVHVVKGRIVWMADELAGGFGVQFLSPPDEAINFLENVRKGHVSPEAVTIRLDDD